ncbi:MAG: DUF364 domain-containing protein [Clostridia bacterium]|nr:DUF364 domain-containing protein [Clostridia bacterium]
MSNSLYEKGSILLEVVEELKNNLGDKINSLTVERVVIGLFYTGIKLSNGDGGICFTPVKAIPEAVCCPSSARAMPASGKLKGKSAAFFLDEMFSNKPLKKALGIAVLNALSSTCWRLTPPHNYLIELGLDPLDKVTIPDESNVAVVGALAPYLKMLKKRSKPFSILELDTKTLKPDEMAFYTPPEKAPEKISNADLLIITGTTLINDTLENILSYTKPGTETIVVGPTASMLPNAFFRRGVRMIGGIMVTDPDGLLDVLVEAGSGYHFYSKSADRVVISKSSSQMI